MRFEWNSTKDKVNQLKHGVSFELARSVFEDPFHLSIQDHHKEGEERWQTLGLVQGVVILLVAHTYRVDDNDEEVIRIISARKCNNV